MKTIDLSPETKDKNEVYFWISKHTGKIIRTIPGIATHKVLVAKKIYHDKVHGVGKHEKRNYEAYTTAVVDMLETYLEG